LLAVLVLGLLGCLLAPQRLWRSRSARAGLLGVAFVYGVLAASSVVLEEFVVYGRSARQLMPFLCLAAAPALGAALASMSTRRRMHYEYAVVLILIVQAAFNMAVPLRQQFPADMLRAAEEMPVPLGYELRVINAKHFYPLPEPEEIPRGSIVLREEAHPLQYLPYQYEGYTPAERSALRSADITMRVLAVPAR
jgi:hypothetical protein